ncbi:MAG TPA: phosphatidate cytidylyltransferase [Mucilaginibacter sp.]|jgi:phosphatidate cytidylyltransferase|nr:phosphatidate cytidylyltransferase [Mucilaginibacter sp.]
MKTRAITGFFFIIVMLASMLLGQYVFGIFYLVLSALALREFYGLVKQSGIQPNQTVGIINGVLIYIAFSLNQELLPATSKYVFVLALTLSLIFFLELYKKSEQPFTNIAYTFMGIIYAIIPFTFFHALGFVNGGFNFHIPLSFFIILWSNDTGAYLSGYFFGRTKLFERHSPKKTWEGFIGGVLIAAVAAYILSIYYKELSWDKWVMMAVLIGCFGTLGDLVESMFKRSINVKDSGGILPGHGGLLDRFDGLLLSAPIVYAYLYLITNS